MSGKEDLNLRHLSWEDNALPTELFPHVAVRDSNPSPPDYLSGALPTELTAKYSLQTGLEPA